MEIVIYAKTVKKLRICRMRAVGFFFNKVKVSDSNRRPKDVNCASTILRSTN